MGSWAFIGLAYGVAAVVLTGYVVTLRGRLRDAGAAVTALQEGGRARR